MINILFQNPDFERQIETHTLKWVRPALKVLSSHKDFFYSSERSKFFLALCVLFVALLLQHIVFLIVECIQENFYVKILKTPYKLKFIFEIIIMFKFRDEQQRKQEIFQDQKEIPESQSNLRRLSNQVLITEVFT